MLSKSYPRAGMYLSYTEDEGKVFYSFNKEEKDMKLFIDNISKEFKDLKAVDNVKIEFTPGQAVTTPRSDVMYVVTEYGLADLYNRPIKERVEAMISIAHPDFRQWLKNIFTLN